MKVDGIVADLPTLAKIGEFNPLNLKLRKTIAHHRMASVVAGVEGKVGVIRAGLAVLQNRRRDLGLDQDAAGEQSDGGAIFKVTRLLSCRAVRIVLWTNRT